MKYRPILFSAPMVRALLDGTKTQTRRTLKPQPVALVTSIYRPFAHEPNNWQGYAEASGLIRWYGSCPYGQPGDRLWVREAWQYYNWNEEGEPCIRYAADNAESWPEPGTDVWAEKLLDLWAGLSAPENFKIDGCARDRRWRPSIHMPRWASRITLEITAVRVERLQDINEADAKAEGCEPAIDVTGGREYHAMGTYRDGYALLWERINGPASWDANPWVWVVEFKRVEK